MPTVTFPNGKSVNFEREPSPQDIDEVAREIGITPETQETPVAQPTTLGTVGNVGIGVAKGIGSTFQGLGQVGEGVLRHTAGRVVSATQGKGFVPTPKEELTYASESPSGQRMEQALTPQGTAQKAGYYGEKLAEIVSPVGAYRALTKAPKIAGVIEAVTPKATAGKIREAYKSGRAGVQGVLRQVGIGPDKKTLRAAEAAKDIIKPNLTAAENSNAVLAEIGREADSLVTALKSSDFKLLVQPEEIDGVINATLKEIGENPTLVGNAETTAVRIFDKFKSFLPTGRDITAEDILDARKRLDAWIKTIKGDKIFDPATENSISLSLRALRQNANELLIAKAPDVGVKDSLSRQSALYDALEGLVSKAPAEVGTTAVGRYLGRHPVQKELLKGVASALPLGVGGYLLGKSLGE